MEQNTNTSLKNKAVNWFMSLDVKERIRLSDEYYPEYAIEKLDLEDEEIETIYLKEHPTEAEVSKEEETVQQAADNFSTRKIGLNGEGKMKDSIKEHSFMEGANWQKEKDRELIEELLSALKTSNSLNLHIYEPDTVGNRAYKVFQKAITKAEKHLNQ